ncbi:DUF4145 domain-containing protein [Lysinibacillus sp. OL1_EC]|uniref:DUF4145 domain-containing protein n=1 Tax=unclassified Lysinibacillus TaxID=2636778 RepID=UPI00103A96F0|nr:MULTISPECIES: DUF4145 domain-containing protein [unclassified Lysinibacillus]MCM0626688.1 DUF4145 domain-containing protein [Lysinibacillus sp. OL1_EC]TBV89146.1 DUF4145 domain-containing protein [Lysinibacillus sp. OL1]
MVFSGEWMAEMIENSKRLTYNCGYCGSKVSPANVLPAFDFAYPRNILGVVAICTACNKPSYLNNREQVPSEKYGKDVMFLPEDIQSIFEEAKKCYMVGAWTAASLICRKILMNISVLKGAKEGKSFISYVDFLEEKGYIPPDGRSWVDEIRKQGNEATHEIHQIREEDALEILDFTTMLLIFMFELPGKMSIRNK